MNSRELYTARLTRKVLLSAPAECYHFEFTFEGAAPATFEPGQFLSLVAEDPAGKTYTRAYSLASAPCKPGTAPSFDLCVNRVAGGFFSNLLCNLREGDVVTFHGPHGLFILKHPPADGLLIAAGTGIAPMRGFTQRLFPEIDEPDPSAEQEYWLVYEAAAPDELFYDSYFRELADSHPNFHYLPVPGGGENHEAMEQQLARVAPSRVTRREEEASKGIFHRYAYVCGLNELVKPARAKLVELGWQKRQILFERYD